MAAQKAEEKWEEAGKLEDLKEGIPTAVKVDKKNILLVKIGDEVHACGAKCTHYGGPLKDGVLKGLVVTCPLHTARFDVSTGEVQSPPALDHLPSYDTKVQKGKVMIRKREREAPKKTPARKKETFVILGAGAAGTSAALTLRRRGFTGRLVMLTAEAELPYDRPNLSKDFLTGEVKREWMSLNPPDVYKNLEIEIWTNHKAIGIDLDDNRLGFAHGSQLGYDKLLLATGGIPRTPGLPGTDTTRFFLLRSFSDAEAVLKALEGSREVIIIGASFIGLEVAASLRSKNLSVHVVAPEKVPMAKVFGDRIGGYVQALHESKGVRFHLGVDAEELTGEGDRRTLKLSDGTSITADLVIAGVGVVPAVNYLDESGLVENGAVPVDRSLQTKREGVFAAGDIAVVPDPASGKGRRIEHWVEAERQGQHAALAMLGEKTPYSEVPFFWTKQYDSSLKYVGNARSWDAVAYRGNVESGNFLAGFYEKGRLLAAAGSGRATDIILLGEILRAGGTVPQDRLQDDGFDLASAAK
jgi:NADPH-dependent 2,4-dienoyl-CoA reductase/sulfur reductase-like enzyme/nitrite reductase/ring-hydroxylating ferredoxin subunit